MTDWLSFIVFYDFSLFLVIASIRGAYSNHTVSRKLIILSSSLFVFHIKLEIALSLKDFPILFVTSTA